MRKKKKKNNGIKVIFLLLFIAVVAFILYEAKDNENYNDLGETQNVANKDVIQEENKLQIYSGNDRIIAVMIDNEEGAYPQAGLQDAFIIYECIVEGGSTRLMALFKGVNTEKIGPIRSSRHYFVEYASEYDAIYAHFGWSPQAASAITKYSINNINGMYYDGSKYWREGTGYHTAFTNIENLKAIADEKQYDNNGSEETPYNYSIEEYNLENGKNITNVKMTYSWFHVTEYEYDEENKVFLRFQRGEAHTDRVTNKQYYAKNIIILKVKNYNIGDGTMRQELDSIGTGEGFYLTNGKYIEITWSKESATSKTYFYDKEGNEIILNDGLTFIQVVPIENEVEFEDKNAVITTP